jgi:outer membrane protein assembly factor BamB
MRWDFPNAANYDASSIRLLLWNRWKDQIPTWTFAVLSPNPVGVGQQMTIVMFNPQLPYGASAANDVRYEYTVDIVKPDGTSVHLPTTGTFVSDSTGSGYTAYTPDQVGNYTIKVTFEELLYRWYNSGTYRDYYGVTYKSSSFTDTLVVQEEQVVPTSWTPTPLPTEYWTRPIEGQNTEWYKVASNWYGNARDKDNGGGQNRFQQGGVAPNSAHIIWTKPTEDGGLVGGGNFSTVGEVYNAGHQYQTRFTQQIIMMGKLYYLGPRYWAGDGDIYRCVDLKTGQTIWERNITGSGAPTFGYQYDWDDMNQHGIVNPGLLFTNDFARAYHPLYGDLTGLNITNAPSLGAFGYTGTTSVEVAGPKGEMLRYVLDSNGWLAQWNSSKVFTSQSSGNIIANVPITPSVPTTPPPQGRAWSWNGTAWALVTGGGFGGGGATAPSYDWNISAPWRVGMTGGSVTIRAVQFDDVLLGSNGSHPVGSGSLTYHYPDEVTFWAISLKPENRGQLLWTKNIQTAARPGETGEFKDNHLLEFQRAAEGVFVMIEMPYQAYVGFDMHTGQQLWKAEAQADWNPFGYYSYPSLIYVEATTIAYGKLFVGGYTGMIFCYDLYNGTLLWRYEAPSHQQIFKYYPLEMGAIADGKLYVGTHEHSADTPLLKGNKIRALDINTGKEVWTMYGWGHPQTMAVADGTLIYWNNYDHQIYAIAKGPSATTVQAPLTALTLGSSLVITGTVTDISPGTQQLEQAKRFPNGVPAVSDASMGNWMEYVYMEKARPMNATGVEVTLNVLDANNNFREIGKTTSDTSGMFSYNWTPDVPGKYTVYASFAGSESFYPSYAEAAFAVDPAPEPAPVVEVPTPPPTEMYVTGAAIAIIIAVAIVGALLAMMLRKRP